MRVSLSSIMVATLLNAGLALAAEPKAKPAAKPVHVVMKTSAGVIEIELDKEKAPISTENFVSYAKEGHYNKTVFHRVIPGFMIQGGGMEANLTEKAVKPGIKNESGNGLTNVRGSLAMARRPDPDSATSQFYINLVDNGSLDSMRYAVFGKVVKGMDVVDKIAQVPTQNAPNGMQNVPVTPVTIESVTVK